MPPAPRRRSTAKRSVPANSKPPASIIPTPVDFTLRRALWIEQLGAVLEVHGVEVVPTPTPDEPLGLEGVHDLLWNRVLPTTFVPAPVVRARGVDVDGDAPGVGGAALGASDG